MGPQPQLARNRDWVEAAVRQFRADLETLVNAYADHGKDVTAVLGDAHEFGTRTARAVASMSAVKLDDAVRDSPDGGATG